MNGSKMTSNYRVSALSIHSYGKIFMRQMAYYFKGNLLYIRHHELLTISCCEVTILYRPETNVINASDCRMFIGLTSE